MIISHRFLFIGSMALCAALAGGCRRGDIVGESLGAAVEPGTGCTPATTGACTRDPLGSGVMCSTWDPVTHAFSLPSVWGTYFNDFNGWNGFEYAHSIRYPDVNGDGRLDVCGRGSNGIVCGLSTGSSFGQVSPWSTAFSNANGWDSATSYWASIQYPDVNGDGKADVCGRGPNGIVCDLSSGSNFGGGTLTASSFSDANGWSAPEYWKTVQFPDVDGDGKADVCGRAPGGIWCAVSTGTAFAAGYLWESTFSDLDGWNTGVQYYGTIQFPDVDGDGKADVCGRGAGGIWCALSTGTTFGLSQPWQMSFSDANGWNAPAAWSSIQYPHLTNSVRSDVCGLNGTIKCALSNGSTAFGPLTTWSSASISYPYSLEFQSIVGNNVSGFAVLDDGSSPVATSNRVNAFNIFTDGGGGGQSGFNGGDDPTETEFMPLVLGSPRPCVVHNLPRRLVARGLTL